MFEQRERTPKPIPRANQKLKEVFEKLGELLIENEVQEIFQKEYESSQASLPQHSFQVTEFWYWDDMTGAQSAKFGWRGPRNIYNKTIILSFERGGQRLTLREIAEQLLEQLRIGLSDKEKEQILADNFWDEQIPGYKDYNQVPEKLEKLVVERLFNHDLIQTDVIPFWKEQVTEIEKTLSKYYVQNAQSLNRVLGFCLEIFKRNLDNKLPEIGIDNIEIKALKEGGSPLQESEVKIAISILGQRHPTQVKLWLEISPEGKLRICFE